MINEFGSVSNVYVVNLGSELVQDAGSGDTVLYMNDVSDLDPNGGALELVSQDGSTTEAVTYSLVDYDGASVTLDAVLVNDFVMDDRVDVYPRGSETYAQVAVAEDGDTITVRVPHALETLFPEGVRDWGQSETVQIESVNQEWVITDVLGKTPIMDGSYIDPETLPDPTSDGLPPASSPTPVVTGGVGAFHVRWVPIDNHDPVTYKLHMGTSAAFSEGPATVYVATMGASATVTTLPAGGAISVGTTYYFKIVASDEDGDADVSSEVSAQLNGALATLQADLDAAEAAVAAAQAEINVLEDTTIPGLESDIAANAAAVAAAQADVDAAEADIVTLQTDLDAAEADLATAMADIATLNTTTLPDLQDELDAAEAAVIVAQAAADAAQATADGILPITETDISDDAITTPKIAANAVTASEIAANAVTAAKIDALAVTTGKLDAGAVTAAKIAAHTITANEIAASTITANEVAANTLTANEIAANAITTSELNAGAVTTAKIAAGAVTAVEIAADTITAAQIAASAITASELAANSVTAAKIVAGTITATELAAGSVTTAKIAAGAVTANEIAAGTITAAQISSGYLYAGNITVDQLTGGTLSADVTLSSTISTATSGARVEMGPFGLILYGSDGTPSIVLPTGVGQSSTFKGNVEAGSLTVTGDATFRSNGNEIARGGVVTLNSTLTAPKTAPSIVQDWEYTVDYDASGRMSSPKGLVLSGGNWYSVGTAAGTFVPKVISHPVAGGTGTVVATVGSPHGGTYDEAVGITKIGTDWYIMYYWESSGGGGSSGYDIGRYNSSWVLQASAAYTPVGNTDSFGVGTDGTNLLIAEFANLNPSDLKYRVQYRNATTLAVGSTLTTGNAEPFSTAQFLGAATGVSQGSFDYGVASVIVQTTTYTHRFTTAGVHDYTGSFPNAAASVSGMDWDGTNFYSASPFYQLRRIYKHTGIKGYDPDDSASPYVTCTWRDNDGTGGTHETTMGAAQAFNPSNRARITLTSPAIPDSGGTDDPNAVRFYMSSPSASPPTRTSYWLQTQPADGVNTVTLTSIAGSGTNPPSSNNFPAATAALVNNDTATLAISGDGSINAASLSVAGVSVPTGLQTVNVYTSNNTWIKPAGCKSVQVEVVGGGGGGGGAQVSIAGSHSVGAGGGGGGYARKTFAASALAGSISITVGAAGASNSGLAGGTGGTSTFSHTSAVSATGGTGGQTSNTATTSFGINPGTGGTSSGGDINCTGGAGTMGYGDGTFSASGSGGSSVLGGGGAGKSSAVASSQAGAPGGAYGGGGSGAIANGAAAVNSGGAGAAGVVIVTNYF